MKRLALGMVLAVGLIPVPARAQGTVEARVQQPATYATVQGTVTVRAEGSAAGGLRKIELFVNAVQVATKSWTRITEQVNEHTIEYRWDTNFYPRSTRISNNGEYLIKVIAVSRTGERDNDTAKVFVDNPPAAVSGLQAASEDSKAQLTWAPNPEPDVLAYIVERDAGEGFTEAARVESTSYADEVKPGDYVYRVTALRYSSRSPDGIAGPGTTSAPVKVLPPAYDYGSAGKAGRSGARGSARAGGDGKSFEVGGRRVGRVGLPGGIALPGRTGLPDVPQTPAWGTYEEQLPFGKARPARFPETRIRNIAAMSPDGIIPPDGLRWVAAGLWLIVAAGMLTFAGRRLGTDPPRSLVPLHLKA